jgi:hypothetical protein
LCGARSAARRSRVVPQETIELEWILPESEKDAQVRAFELAGADVEDSGGVYRPRPDELADYPAAGFEPMTMIAVAASAVFVIESLTKLWRDRSLRGATIVDTRGGKVRVRRVPSMPHGQLVLVEDGGSQIFNREQANDGAALLRDILPKFGKKKD